MAHELFIKHVIGIGGQGRYASPKKIRILQGRMRISWLDHDVEAWSYSAATLIKVPSGLTSISISFPALSLKLAV